MNKKNDDNNEEKFSIKNILLEGNNNDLTCLIGRYVIYILCIYFICMFFYYVFTEDTISIKKTK